MIFGGKELETIWVTSLLREERGQMCWVYTMEQYVTPRNIRGLCKHKVNWIDLKNIRFIEKSKETSKIVNIIVI